MPKIPAFLTVALLAAAGFTSCAEAHGFGFHSPVFFRDEGPMGPPHHHCQAREEREFAIEQERQRELAELRAEQAAGAAQKAAAAKRARMLAMRKEEAREEAQEADRRATANAAAKTQQIQQPVEAPNVVAQKGDLLPSAGTGADAATASTASAETTTAAVSEPASVASSDQQTCRKYSAATDGLIDTPCQ